MPKDKSLPLKFFPLTPRRWRDLERLFGARGGCGGCWCMWWRLKRPVFEKQKGAANKKAFHKIVDGGEVPGILAYAAGEPVGWCAFGPRETYPVLESSRTLKRVDDQPVWSVVCLFVRRDWRRRGVTVEMLKAAAAYARKHGAKLIEGYPVEPRKAEIPSVFAWTGLASGFRKAGFLEVARRSPTRPILRRELAPARGIPRSTA